MRKTETRRLRRGLLALVAVLGLVALEPTVASATHVFPNSSVTCERQDATTGTFDCTLTIVIGRAPFTGGVVVRPDDDPSIGVAPEGAAYLTLPTRTGGTCAPTATVATGFGGVRLVLTDNLLSGCTIILRETLAGNAPGELCHRFSAIATNSVSQVAACVQLLPALEPTTKQQCKKGGWRRYASLGFRNQGDCVSFVATSGKKPPRGPGQT